MPLDIREDYTMNLRRKLCDNELDAIVISLPFQEPGVQTEVLYQEEFVVLMPSKHPLAKMNAIDEKALLDYNVILLGKGHVLRDQIISSLPLCFKEDDPSLDSRWYSIDGSSLETIRHMVASGMGITILPKTATSYGAYGSKLLTIRPLVGKHPGRTVALAWRKNYPRHKAIETVIKAIKACHLAGVNR